MIVRLALVGTLRFEDHGEQGHHLAVVVDLHAAKLCLKDPLLLLLRYDGDIFVEDDGHDLRLLLDE